MNRISDAEKKEIEMRKILKVILVCVTLICVSGCSGKNNSRDRTYKEENLEVAEQAVEVSISENTATNFDEGIYVYLDGDILEDLKDAVSNLEYDETDDTIPDARRDSKYRISFIDDSDSFILSIMVGKYGELWDSNGRFKHSDELSDWLDEQIDAAQKQVSRRVW